MSTLRTKPLQKPHILKQITYNHRIQINDSQSQPSFLKLSSRGSIQLSHNQCNQLFYDMNKRLNRIQSTSIQKVKQLKSRLEMYEQAKIEKRMIDKHLMVERKEKIPLAFRKLQNYQNYVQNFQECNFQMDQNRNYILSQQLDPPKTNKKPQVKQSESQPQNKSNKLKLSIIQKQNTSSKVSYSASCPKNSLNSTPKKSTSKSLKRALSSKNNHIKTRKTLESGCNEQTKRSTSRIYQQILSLYSTARLLAMQKKIL